MIEEMEYTSNNNKIINENKLSWQFNLYDKYEYNNYLW
jgi:hypothetical protein